MNKTSIQENGEVILDGQALSNIEVMALFAQYRDGNKILNDNTKAFNRTTGELLK